MQETNTTLQSIRKCFWDRLQKLLIEKGKITQKNQWEYLDISKSTLLNWKNGFALPGHSELVRIAHLLGCSIDYLIDESITVETSSTDIQGAIKTTGLSENAVKLLSICHDRGMIEVLNALNSLIVSDIQTSQMIDGKWKSENRPDPFNRLMSVGNDGSIVHVTGLIHFLQRNLEASIEYEKENAELEKMTKGNTQDLQEWNLQAQKTSLARTNVENSGYRMMLMCTTATAEDEQYHERLKEVYKEGGRGNGKH